MPKIEAFEKYSDAYDEWFKKNLEMYEAELEAIRQLLPPPGAQGMEIGVGSGKFAAPLGIKIGVEPSEKMAIKAKRQGIDVYPGVAEALPFADGRFDFALMVTTICFVDDVIKSFREAFRILKPNGCIIVGFVDKESDLGRQYLAKKEKSRFYKDAVFFSASQVLACLREAGFGVIETRQTLIPGKVPEIILEGFGRGAFVVIKGVKNRRQL
ncbi:MAG: class I SAM-dependent methyltransferase [Desulfobacteraceae bacterium]|jgi:SAM-dependent methyltransferase